MPHCAIKQLDIQWQFRYFNASSVFDCFFVYCCYCYKRFCVPSNTTAERQLYFFQYGKWSSVELKRSCRIYFNWNECGKTADCRFVLTWHYLLHSSVFVVFVVVQFQWISVTPHINGQFHFDLMIVCICFRLQLSLWRQLPAGLRYTAAGHRTFSVLTLNILSVQGGRNVSFHFQTFHKALLSHFIFAIRPEGSQR